MQDIFLGVVIIGIGLAMGGSIFLGQFTLFNIFFDGLGLFFIGKGAVGMMRPKNESTAVPSQPAAVQNVDGIEGATDSLEVSAESIPGTER